MSTPHLTSELMWTGALIAAVLDVILLWLVARIVRAERFRQLEWPLAAVTTVFWVGVWTFALWGPWWGLAYHDVFPQWARWAVPPVYGLLFGAVAMGVWWVAQRLPGPPAVWFCLLGGLVSLPGHLVGFSRGLLTDVPVLQGVSAASALVFGVFEFVAYWSVIVLVAAAFGRRRPRA